METTNDNEKSTCRVEMSNGSTHGGSTEGSPHNGHTEISREPSLPANQDSKENITRENGVTSSRCAEFFDRMQAQFIAISESISQLDSSTRDQAMDLIKKARPLLSVNNATLGSGSEDQVLRLWTVCILYCAVKISVNGSEASMCKLSHILDGAKVSAWDFFKELPQFLLKLGPILEADNGNALDKLKQVKDFQASFNHLAVLFNYYKRNYNRFFLSSRMMHCSCSKHLVNGASITCDHLRFGWMLFLALRDHVLAQFDLVTCTNGLIAILVVMILHVPTHRRKFSSLKADLFGVRGPTGVNIVGSLCKLFEASEDDVLIMYEKVSEMICKILNVSYTVNPTNTFDQLAEIDTEKVMFFEGLMGESSLCAHLEILNKNYEESFKHNRELDERLFLDGGDAAIGMLYDGKCTGLGEISNTTCAKRKYETTMMSPVKAYSIRNNLMSPPGSPKPSPVKVNSHKMPPLTPVSSTMTSAKWLRTVIAPLSAEPSSSLLQFFQSCDSDITKQVKFRAQVLLEAIFSSEKKYFWGLSGGINGLAALDSTWAEQRRLEALKLYYKVLGSMCQAESQRLQCENLSALLMNERFHRCMLACSAELVLATYKTVSMNFPAVLEPAGITAFDIWKVIESFVRHEETLPRDLKRHLNSIEEKILEKLAWEKGSSLYDSLIIAKPNLQEEIYKLNLLAEPMPSLEALHSRYQLVNSGDKQGLLYSPRKCLTPTRWLSSMQTRLEKSGRDFLSPVKDRQPASPTITLMKARVQPPLQSAFASPQRVTHVGGETCAESIVTIFLQKALKLAAIRIKNLCESLDQTNIMVDVYNVVEHVLFNETGLLFKRHIDQILLCSTYGVCKVKKLNVTFKQILRHYQQNPHDSYVYQTVFFNLPSGRPLQNGRQGTGDIICFYNAIFVPALKELLMQLSKSNLESAESNEDVGKIKNRVSGSPGPSPFSSLPDMSPRKVSAKHNVYVSPLRSSKIEPLRAPSSRSLYACVGESTHAYESPSKDLSKINNRVNGRHLGKLDFGDSGLVSDSLVLGNLCSLNATSMKQSSVDSRQPQQLPVRTTDGNSPKRICMDR
ncbi:hypothetical protein KP509_28G046300 [Ceratopteris richardii]|uniref:Retinoblastoma-related protein n=5 Tax=Ceratopteris richardii TaxID=49495 RepID=A0A8T2RDE1_CERRI|nr:hypothetical protein KP509_28G046300 [Ceratopteris richardii]KAH7293873.1 hypothetical protein KP509_28G046300 [Ceratopteris richardii]